MKKFIFCLAFILTTIYSSCYAHKPYNELEIKTVNLEVFPKKSSVYAAGTEVTIGDLHGNAIKLLYFLINSHVLNLSKGSYKLLLEIYKKKPEQLTAEDLTLFRDLVDQGTYSAEQKIRFLGDDLCDRGMNDYFTLLIYKKLDSEDVPFEIVLSNHGNFFLEAYESLDHDFSKNPYGQGKNESIVQSMLNLAKIINRGLVNKEEVIQIVQTHYLKHIVFPGYLINKNKKEITIFSHAPLDLQILNALAQDLQVKYSDRNLDDLSQSFNAINTVMTQWIMSNNFTKHYTELNEAHTKSNTESPIHQVLWNRDYAILDRNYEPENKPYFVNYVHGHDSEPNVFDLDNLLGKGIKHNKGPYAVHLTHE
ncbi:MAG: hypothetical protein EPN84_08565 [Legionella sp.]|nr:MAG: hypothetical protein EPN84_08565 [Legionella sp.]